MAQKFLYFLTLLVLLFITKTSFLVTNAFLGDDLGLNLYNQIDSGIDKLEGLNYNYELQGQDKKGKIEDQINNILETKGFGDCKIEESLSSEDLDKISDGEIELLYNKLSEECKYEESIDISVISAISSHIKTYKNNAIKKSINKSKHTYDISRIGMYADGDLQNSPFDIIKDIQDIDYIVFTEEIEYKGETPINDGGLSDYLLDKYRDTESKWNSNFEKKHEKSNPSIEKNTNTYTNIELANVTPIYGIEDGTQYMCADYRDDSGLSGDELINLLDSTSGTGSNDGLTNSGTEELPSKSSTLPIPKTNYQNVSDDSVWKCSKFFCITIDFIINKHSLFGNEKMRSIQSIVEKSNEHLKKFVNTSLIQSKMTTNNFEIGLRDLQLPDIFSFGLVVTKKSPPILKLENFYKDKEEVKKNDPFSSNNLFCRRWESIGGNCERINDLSIFLDSDAEEKTINDSAELSLQQLAQKQRQREILQEVKNLQDDFINKAIQRDSQLNESEELYQEYLELEKFVANMKDYSFDLNAIVKKMLEIPIHP